MCGDGEKSSPDVNPDFFHGDVGTGLERIRLRLLDLTNRNRLLNFRHTKKSSLRVVDEIPDQLFEFLIDGRTLWFQPVPQPRRRDWIFEDTQQLTVEFTEGRDGPPKREPTPEEHAETLGISTSFDLPSTLVDGGEVLEARHTDREIQTLQYPEKLEAILRSISRAARLAIEETGTNMLFLSMGFLRWYDSDDSEQERFAPLVLVPASLERGSPDARTHVYRYAVQHSGEDIVANISLQEKMRRDFGIEIPEFGEDDTPESYCRELTRIVAGKERWRVHRQITLCLLSFGKLLMYRDLDPNTWPGGKSPAQHPRIREFFEGIQRDEITVAPDYCIDDPELGLRVPAIVFDADSSQHSALIDAVAGKNLVIQGPPGTGKSQTISNLIAVALSEGKNVLFVSEKLAALEVVRHRLNEAGLGGFCLELHSHKTQKRALLDDVGARILERGSFTEPFQLGQTIDYLEETKKRLTDYVALINSPFGCLGRTVNEILWWVRRTSTLLPISSSHLENLFQRNSESLPLPAVSERRQLLRQYRLHYQAVASDGRTLRDHPWSGVVNPDLTFLTAPALVETLEEIRSNAGQLLDWITGLCGRTSMIVEPESTAVGEFIEAALCLPVCSDPTATELVPFLADSEARLALERFLQTLGTFQGLREELNRELEHVPDWGVEEENRLRRLVEFVAEGLRKAPKIGDLPEMVTALEAAATQIARGKEGADALRKWLQIDLILSSASLPAAIAVSRLANAAPVSLLHRRGQSLGLDGAVEVVTEAIRVADPLKTLRLSLSQRLHLHLAPDYTTVRQHAVAAANAKWWGFIERSFREARRAHKAMIRSDKAPSRRAIKEDLQELARYLQASRSFCGNRAFIEVSGDWFEGIDTPFDEILQVAEWGAAIRGAPELSGGGGKALGKALWELPSDRVQGLVSSPPGGAEVLDSLASAEEGLSKVEAIVSGSWCPEEPEDLEVYSARLREVSAKLATGFNDLRAAGLPEEFRIQDVPQLIDRVGNLRTCAGEIQAADEVERILSSRFRAEDTRPEVIEHGLWLYRELMAAEVPESLKDWLATEDTGSRLNDLRGGCMWAREALGALREATDSFSSAAALEENAWFYGKDQSRWSGLSTISSRAQEALEARGQLSEWLDYIQARKAAQGKGLSSLLSLVEAGTLQPQDLELAFDFVLSSSMAREVFEKHPELVQFSGLSHEQLREHFAELDREVLKLSRQKFAATLDQRWVPVGISTGLVRNYSEYSLIDHELSKQRRHIPIRQLVRRAGKALQGLKPCFMMGPLSVAQYLPAGKLEFDLVVMDEASQLKPEDALGAIARAEQVVIVGDPMQLPPTSFFDRIGDEEDQDDDERQAIADAESILDVASHLYKPPRLLRWHYRSRHGSLIAYSNKEFYKGELIVFPSPLSQSPELGIKFVHVRDGVYEGRRNMTEAMAVVDAAFDHMQNRPWESLGIVTLNIVQREVIENELDHRLKTDPFAQEFIERHKDGLEPLFVKNLENVQGDERDVIYVSVTYGPNENGRVFQRFGPINGVTGHRRLNVLFTRARRRLGLFSSMLSDNIVAHPSSSAWGVRALKGYLQYAQTGILDQATVTGREPDSDFEAEVADALGSRGFDVVAQVGVAGFFIDLAVKHPSRPDAFVLGIECDGATYHSSRSARDRDRLRQSILEDLGWELIRIWSTDWFKDPAAQIERVSERLRQVLETEGEEFASAEPETIPTESQEPEESTEESAPSLSVDEAKAELVRFREEIVNPKFPSTSPTACIIRDEMIGALLRHRPRDHTEWLDRIPFELRMDSEFAQMEYLDEILRIVARVST